MIGSVSAGLRLIWPLVKIISWIKEKKILASFAEWRKARRIGTEIRVTTNILNFKPTPATERLLEEMYTLGDHFLYTSTGTPWQEHCDRFHSHPGIYTALVPVDVPGSHPVGYFVILPLSPSGEAALRDGKIRASKDLRLTDITTPEAAEAIYVSAVHGTVRAAPAVAQALLVKIKSLAEAPGSQLRYIYTRPTTSPGRSMFRTLAGRESNRDSRLEVIDVFQNPGSLISLENRIARAKTVLGRRSIGGQRRKSLKAS